MYDLETDPEEMNNIYSDSEYNAVKNNMHNQLISLIDLYQDTVALQYQTI